MLLKEYIEEIIDATSSGELHWERGTTNLLKQESEKSDLLKKIGIYDGLVEEQKEGWAERVLDWIYFAEIVPNQKLIVCEYCYDYMNPWDSHTWVDVYLVKENEGYRLVEHGMCYEPEDYDFCSRVVEKWSDAIRESHRQHLYDISFGFFEGLGFN